MIHENQPRGNRLSECLQPIPALDDKTTRQALRTKNGRQRVIAWLKYLENGDKQCEHNVQEVPMCCVTWNCHNHGRDTIRVR